MTTVSPAPAQSPPTPKVALALALAVFGLSFYFTRDRMRTEELRHLGAEYYNVARALTDGRGYADPFGEATGPTAWMPPLYTALIAGLLWVLKTKNAVALAVIVLQDLALIGIGAGIYAVARRSGGRLSALASVAFYLVWLALFHYWFFILTTDIWLIASLVTLMLLAVSRWLRDGQLRVWLWASLAGVATLVNPALAAAWSCLTLVAFVRTAQPLRAWSIAGVIALTLALPWSLRNLSTFGKFIPTKSNLGYELYLANVIDEDGVYDNLSMQRHPYHSPLERFEYARLGETGYIASGMQRFRSALSAEPEAYFRRVGHRLLAATLLYAPNERELAGPILRVAQRVVYAMPVALFLASIWRRGRQRGLLAALGLLAGAALAPYVLVAFYPRYVFPLTPVFVVVWFLGVDVWVSRFARSAPSNSTAS